MKKILFQNTFKKMQTKVLKYFLSCNFVPSRFEFAHNDKCLCLCPHQDDETIGMGGTLSRFFDIFDVICLTNGAKGFKNKPKDEAIKIRADEFKCAMEHAKIKNFEILDIEDRALFDAYSVFSKIDFKKYDYIFLPNPVEQHKDHKAVSVLLHKYLMQNEVKKGLKIAFYEVWAPLSITNMTICISDFIEQKKKMLECYVSQCAQRSYYDAAIGLSAYRGLIKEQKFAEAYLCLEKCEFLNMIKEIYPYME